MNLSQVKGLMQSKAISMVDSGEKRYRWSVVCEKHGAMSPRFMTKKQAGLYVVAWGIDWCVEGEE
jgi:hypothetical protein